MFLQWFLSLSVAARYFWIRILWKYWAVPPSYKAPHQILAIVTTSKIFQVNKKTKMGSAQERQKTTLPQACYYLPPPLFLLLPPPMHLLPSYCWPSSSCSSLVTTTLPTVGWWAKIIFGGKLRNPYFCHVFGKERAFIFKGMYQPGLGF